MQFCMGRRKDLENVPFWNKGTVEEIDLDTEILHSFQGFDD